jgi:hypothetical protein
LTWLDATAALCAEGLGAPEIRTRLAPVIGQQIASAENQRKAADILINIWINTASISPALHGEAIAAFGRAATAADRLVLHYGLALLAYPFLRETAAVIGALTRSAGELTQVALKQRLIAGRGQLGSLEKAVERILASLTDWGALNRDRQRHTYTPPAQPIGAASVTTETWLLACAALAHPAEELPFSDLLRLPELYPFRFSVSVDDLRACPWFAVQRQGGGWDMVRLSGVLSWPTPPPAIPNMARMTMSF